MALTTLATLTTERLDELLGFSTGLALFPIRHHSPTCARHLEAFLRAYRPSAVLIEGPAAFNDRIGVLADPEHEAPFALVAVVHGPGGAEGRAYYPFCDYSPELVALRVAKEIGAEARFIDLVLGSLPGDLASGASGGRAAEERLGAAEDGQLARSRFTRAILERSGCRDFDEVWETLFEQGGWDKTPEEWARSAVAYALLSREGYSAAELAAEGTLEREQAMAGHIAEARKEHARVAVVTGAFHTAGLRAHSAHSTRKTPGSSRTGRPEAPRGAPAKSPAARGKAPRRPLPAAVFVAPYTFPRLDALLGYASGMSGPQFYQYVWEARAEGDPFAAAALRVLILASRLARADGEVLGTADAIAALAFAEELSRFRGKAHVGRVEVMEAARSCFVKGDDGLVGQRVLGALAEVMRGKKVGRLGPSAGESPLVADFNARLGALRLPLEHGRPQAHELPLFASDLALARSRFFHRTSYLGLDFARRLRGPDLARGEDLHLTVERWAVQFTPEVETHLADLSPLGATIEDVAAALLVKDCLASEGKAGELAMHLLRALVMGLHRAAERLLPRLAAAMFADDDVLSLLAAGGVLRNVREGRERLGAAEVKGLPDLARQAYVQGTLRLGRLAAMGPDRLVPVVAALQGLLDVTLTAKDLAPERALLIEHARAARDAARGKAQAVLGALDGLLLQLGETDLGALARNLTAGGARADGAGAYLEGVLAIARHALLGESALLEALLDHIRTAPWQEFLTEIPSLRRALTRLTPRETEAVAERAAALLGISPGEATGLFAVAPGMVRRLADWEEGVLEAEKAWAGGGTS